MFNPLLVTWNRAVTQHIRLMQSTDLEQVLAWRNHPEVRRFMYTRHAISLDEHRRWFERASGQTDRHLLIYEQQGEPRGFVNLHQTGAGGIADWGFYAAPDAPRGTGRQLGTLALEYAFRQLGLHKVCGQALAFNAPSIRFHLRLGFQQEGRLREQHFDGDGYQDIVCFGLLAAEWHAITER